MTATGNAVRLALISAQLGGERKNLSCDYLRQELPAGWTLDTFFFDDFNFPPRPSLSPRLQAKIPKMLGYELVPGYDFYIWIDSSFVLSHPGAAAWFVRSLAENDIAVFRHPHRGSIAEELSYLEQALAEGEPYLVQRYRGEPLREQVELYLSDPSFRDDALYALGAFVYRKEMLARPGANLFPLWYYHNARYTIQDQLSFPYLSATLAATGLRQGILPGGIFDNPYIAFRA